MAKYLHLIVLVSLLILQSCSGYNPDFLDVPCKEAQDCYVFDDINKGLWLSCWENVGLCKCSNTISSDFTLTWSEGQCLMSKYGPCGSKGKLEVGCADGFVCVEGQCRDPVNPVADFTKLVPYVFQDSTCGSDCNFSEDLPLVCDYPTSHCACKVQRMADGPGTMWDIRNYDGQRNCSVGKFGPCGFKAGITIDCHGTGIRCMDGTCLDPRRPVSGVNESCQSKINCQAGLICSGQICIHPFSLGPGSSCRDNQECQNGLICGRDPNSSPWTSSTCRIPHALRPGHAHHHGM